MEIGDLVQCKYFDRYGIVTSCREHWVKYSDDVVWVVWTDGSHTQYKVKYLKALL